MEPCRFIFVLKMSFSSSPPTTKITFNKKVSSAPELFTVWIYGDCVSSHEPRPPNGSVSLDCKGDWRVVVKSSTSCFQIDGTEAHTNVDRIQLIALLEALKWIPRTPTSKILMLMTQSLYVKNLVGEWLDNWKRTDFMVEDDVVKHLPTGKKKKHRLDRVPPPQPEPEPEEKKEGPHIPRPYTDLLQEISRQVEDKKIKFMVRTTPDPSDDVMTYLTTSKK